MSTDLSVKMQYVEPDEPEPKYILLVKDLTDGLSHVVASRAIAYAFVNDDEITFIFNKPVFGFFDASMAFSNEAAQVSALKYLMSHGVRVQDPEKLCDVLALNVHTPAAGDVAGDADADGPAPTGAPTGNNTDVRMDHEGAELISVDDAKQ